MSTSAELQSSFREWLEFGIQLAQDAGQMMTSASGRSRSVEQKSSFADLVTETDKGVEEHIFSQVKKRYPHHKTIGEESTEAANWTDEPTWIIDPVDGTMNFVHTFPFCCVSIAITYKKEVVIGIVYSPFLGKLFTAIKGNGARCNGSPIKSSNCAKLNEALVVVELGSARDPIRCKALCDNVQALAWKCHGLRSLGSAALNICSVAAGQVDAYTEFGLHCWDMAAAAVIAEESGAIVRDTKGGPLDIMNRRVLVAASSTLADEISSTLVAHPDLERD